MRQSGHNEKGRQRRVDMRRIERVFGSLVICGVAAAALAGEAPAIRATPAFTVAQLMTPPTTQWITNGGTLYNQRYSPLTLINRDNVSDLRALWRTSMGSGTTPGHAGQAQILAHDGVLYVINGANDVFAMDVETGAIRWKYSAQSGPQGRQPHRPHQPWRGAGRGQGLRRRHRRATGGARPAHRSQGLGGAG